MEHVHVAMDHNVGRTGQRTGIYGQYTLDMDHIWGDSDPRHVDMDHRLLEIEQRHA